DVLDGIHARIAPGHRLGRPAHHLDDVVVTLAGRVRHVQRAGDGHHAGRAEPGRCAHLVVVECVPYPGPRGELGAGAVAHDELVVGGDLREPLVHLDHVVEGVGDVAE